MVSRRAVSEMPDAHSVCSRSWRRDWPATANWKTRVDLPPGRLRSSSRLQHRGGFSLSKAAACDKGNEASGRFDLNSNFDVQLSAALLEFNREAILYCQGISDTVAQEYAVDYARMVQNRVKGDEFSLPLIPFGLFEPNRNLIRAALERMAEKHFTPKNKAKLK